MALKGKIEKKDSALAKYLKRKISKKKKEAMGVAAISFGDLIYDLSRIDPRYVLGANFARPSANISSKFKIGKQNLKDLKDPRDGEALVSDDYLNHLHSVNYIGATHEYVTDSYMRSKGIEITIPNKMNQPGWDRIYNGEAWQIKFNDISGIREARLKNPNIPVASDIESAELYKKKFPDDAENVLGTTPKNITQKILDDGKEASMEVHKDEELFETGIPEFVGIASIMSTVKNLNYVFEKKTNTKTAIQNIAFDTAGKGAGMWLGAKVGSIFGPIGSVVGGIGGHIFGGEFINEFKVDQFCEKEIVNLEKNLKEYQIATNKIFERNQYTIEDKLELLDMTLGSENYRKKYLKENKITAELYDFLVEKFISEKKGLERLHYRKKTWLKKYMNIPSDEKLKTVEKFFKNNIEIGIPHYFLKEESRNLVNSAERLVKAMKKRGI
jgi:hypothetical protein